MESFTANEAKNRFGEVILKSQKEPVKVTRSGKPIAVIVSIDEYNATEELKCRYVRENIKAALEDIESGNIEDGDVFFQDLMAGKYDKT